MIVQPLPLLHQCVKTFGQTKNATIRGEAQDFTLGPRETIERSGSVQGRVSHKPIGPSERMEASGLSKTAQLKSSINYMSDSDLKRSSDRRTNRCLPPKMIKKKDSPPSLKTQSDINVQSFLYVDPNASQPMTAGNDFASLSQHNQDTQMSSHRSLSVMNGHGQTCSVQNFQQLSNQSQEAQVMQMPV